MSASTSKPLPEVGTLPFSASATGLSGNGRKTDASLLLHSVSEKAVASGSIPSLSAPRAFDAIDLLTSFLALKTKMADEQVAAGIEDVRHWGEQQRQLHEKISKSIVEAAKRSAEAKNSSGIMKFFGWLTVGLTVLAAIATGAALPVMAAAVSVGVATLVETGGVDKMTAAIVKSLEKDGIHGDKASTLGAVITIGIIFAISVLTVGAGFASGAASGLRIAALIPSSSVKAVQIGQRVSTAARVGGAMASLGEAGAGIANGIQKKEATDAQAEAINISSCIARLRSLQSDEMDFIKQLLLDRTTTTQTVAEAINRQSDSNAKLVRAFG
ncbi:MULTISPECIES: hypothetical protein [Bradyrhizobium]|uniref:Uncharacterized protein n=1 Tax=Bradyrhizobium frederickii TaxID=2560054 RepID=A0A4Y9KS74_9BRAD|nr:MULTISPECIES: hypothetical protein [Bradyrhizobium]TFV29484.1 hypothetical protein E4K66_37555 [Bradyrhizobium frederickii]TFV68047.1 hypothetical protein E4K64_37575 [Bradyrhizobium frederickii]